MRRPGSAGGGGAVSRGDARCVDDLTLLPRAAHLEDIVATTSGFVSSIECERMGIAGVMLGGGRFTKEDSIDPAVGIVLHKKVGDAVSTGEPLCTVHYNSAEHFIEAKSIIEAAYRIAAEKPPTRALVQKVIQGKSANLRSV